jgi:hypothetical protein
VFWAWLFGYEALSSKDRLKNEPKKVATMNLSLIITSSIALLFALALFGVGMIFTRASEQKRLEEQRERGIRNDV